MSPTLFLFALMGVVGAEFSYDRCDSSVPTAGPLYWGVMPGFSTCGWLQAPQSQGSPINLCSGVAFSAPSFTVTGYSTTRAMKGQNSGHSIYLYVIDNRPTLQLGNIAYVVGRSADSSTQTWALQQIHGHWGRAGKTSEGSEHYMQGVAYPMEMHLVHYNTKYGSFSAAVASGATDAILVVGVFLSLTTSDLPILATLGNAASHLTEEQEELGTEVTLSELFDGTGNYYAYKGSLTTPGCNEIVTWVVMQGTKPISLATLNKFKSANITPSTTASTYATYGNYRPIQALNSRTVYSSSGATAACLAYTEAQKTCGGGALLSGPSFFVQILVVVLAVLAIRE
eukprot:GGOE01065367.1.p1 GENE.GGOE01065367.1~~GGOE01065367.1.p1  ORF type:complete len:352 (+),score=34.63 GGOE01065367.1:36-1058(+)